jgi:predicted outer membrane repeat protein
VFVDCLFDGNIANVNYTGFGAGLACFGSNAQLRQCVFADNEAANGGSAFYCEGSTLMLDSCIFSNNGGFGYSVALCSESSNVAMESCTFWGNSAIWSGACIELDSGSGAQVGNTIIASSNYVQAIACGGTSSVVATCDDVWGNEGGDYIGCLAGMNGQDGNISSDPQFCDALGGDFRLGPLSPCAPEVNPACGLIGARPVGCGGTSDLAIEPAAGAPGGRLVLDSVSPNPFGEAVNVTYTLRDAVRVTLTVHDVAGREIAVLENEERPAGRHTDSWNGRDLAGRRVPAGVYFCRLTAGSDTAVRTVVLW